MTTKSIACPSIKIFLLQMIESVVCLSRSFYLACVTHRQLGLHAFPKLERFVKYGCSNRKRGTFIIYFFYLLFRFMASPYYLIAYLSIHNKNGIAIIARLTSLGFASRLILSAPRNCRPPAKTRNTKVPMTAKENISLHQLILYNISERILSGEWPPGYRIPFEHELMVEYNCSRMTVSKVLTHLANNHMIERRRKAGSFVFRPHSQSLVMEIADIKVEVAALGLPYSFDISSCAKRKSEQADCTSLDVRPLSAVLELVCCHYAGRQPFCLEERLINLAAVPEAADETFAEQSPGSWLMSRVPWTTAEHKIIATEPSAAVADALKLSAGKPCLVVERKTWSNNHTVTFVRLTYPGNLHELVARFAPVQSAKRMKIGKAVQDKSRTVSIGTSSAAPQSKSGRQTARSGTAPRR